MMMVLDLIAQISATAAEDSTPTTVGEGTASSVVTPTFGPEAVAYGIGFLFLLAFLVMIIAWWRTWGWNKGKRLKKVRGLGLPNGSVRSILALLIVGGFVLFAFLGRGIVGDNEQFTAILAAWVTLTGAVTGFYFGARTGQTLDPDPKPGNEESEGTNQNDPKPGNEESDVAADSEPERADDAKRKPGTGLVPGATTGAVVGAVTGAVVGAAAGAAAVAASPDTEIEDERVE